MPPLPARSAGQHDARALIAFVCCGTLIALACAALLLLPLRLDRHPPSPDFGLARALSVDGAGLIRFTMTMLLLFALYLGGVLAAGRAGRFAVVIALGFAVLFSVVLLPAHPAYSRDIFHYIATARVEYLYGANPLVVPPDAFPSDPLMRLADWAWQPSPYGPVWLLLQAAPYYAISGSSNPIVNVIAFKALVVACTLATACLIGAIAERLRPGSRASAMVLFSWNPLVLVHLDIDGHNDAAMLLLLVLALYLGVRGRVGLAGWAFAGSVLVKFVSILALLLFVAWLLHSERPARRREALVLALTVPALAAAAYLPFWDGIRTFSASFQEGRYVTTSLPAVLQPVLERAVSRAAAAWVLTTGVRLAFLPLLVVLAWRRGRGDGAQLIALVATTYSLFLTLATPWFMPWYALWPLALGSAVPARGRIVLPVVALSFGALFLPVATAFLAPMSGQGVEWTYMHVVAVCLTFGPFALAVAVTRMRPALAQPRRG